MATDDDDQDALAAEYVLGTLSDEERTHAEALITLDPAFEAAVRHWERRLGELNVMVEAVEPPPEVWDKIKTEIGPVEPAEHIAPPAEEEFFSPIEELMPADTLPPAAGLEPPRAVAISPDVPRVPAPSAPEPEPVKIERGADVIYLARRVKRWRRVTFLMGAIAALLALYVAVWQFAPELVPPQLRPGAAQMLARSPTPGRAAQDRLVAVLQPGPTGPAFLLTLDTRQRTLTVRKVSATEEVGKSYELWLISSRLDAPRSLGIVGSDEFTERPLPGNYDADTLRGATYAVSLEPAGGSKSGAPTGPVLFTGKAVESLPASAPQTPKT
ncbi:MAG: anti-sigma factor [Xanthobacteraceae bacterium]